MKTDRIGQKFGDYRLTRWLGGGSFGDVYLGMHVRDNTPAAVKILQARLIGTNDIKQFINEARTIRLRHPNIVPLLDFGIAADDTPFLIMDYTPNGTLRDRHPRRTRVPLDTVIGYMKQVASALQYAHDKNLIHRDVKPENMLVGPHNEIWLSDFGLAVIQSTSSLNKQFEAAGTPIYMAPEQFKGHLDVASDQYALGIVVYEWLCGEPPFRGDFFQLCYQHDTEPPPPLRNKLPTISLEMVQVVAKALAKDPSQRFSSVSALARALEQASQIQRLFSVEQPSQDRPSLDQIGQPAQLSLTSPLPLPPEQTEEVTQVTQSGNATLDPPSPIKPVSPLYKQEKPIPLITHHRNPSRSKVALFVGLILLIVGSVSFLHPLAAHIVHPQATSTAAAHAATATAITSVHATVTAISNAHATATAISIRYNTATASGIMFGFDVEHTHSNPYEETLSLSNVSKLVQDWTTSTGDGIGSSPVVTNGVVYVGSRDHKLYAFSAAGCGNLSCSPLWAATTGNAIISSPSIANGVVYIGSYDHKLYAFSAVGCGSPSCGPLWTSPATGNAITSSPAVANGVVYIGSYDHKLYAFHLPGTTP